MKHVWNWPETKDALGEVRRSTRTRRTSTRLRPRRTETSTRIMQKSDAAALSLYDLEDAAYDAREMRHNSNPTEETNRQL